MYLLQVQRIKQEMQAEETANMTFTPQLSPRSMKICSAQRDADAPPAWKRLVDSKNKDSQEYIAQECIAGYTLHYTADNSVISLLIVVIRLLATASLVQPICGALLALACLNKVTPAAGHCLGYNKG